MRLNEYQRIAVDAGEGAWKVLATAGSGKTRVLVERAKRLLSKEPPNTVLALTFTVDAAKEMESRIGVKTDKSSRAGFRTFHSLALRIIREEARYLDFPASPSLVGDPKVINHVLMEAVRAISGQKIFFNLSKTYISHCKRNKISPHDALENLEIGEDPVFARIYSAYDKKLRDLGILDYDSLILEAVKILSRHPQVLERYQYKWILVDETQDTDDLQFEFLRLISKQYDNVFAVGDPTQAIYEFRGAKPKNFIEFEKWFPNANTLFLPVNYRSTKRILSFCRQIAPKSELIDRIHTINEEGREVTFTPYLSSFKEAESVVEAASQSPHNSAILARTNAQLGEIESFCIEKGIKFFRLGKESFWKQKEVLHFISLVQFLASNKTPESFMERKIVSLRNVNLPPFKLLSSILDLGLRNFYSDEDYQNNDNFALSNLETVVTISSRFSDLNEFLKHVNRAIHASPRKAKNSLIISTIHRAKGLEWDNVYLVGAEEGKIPHYKGNLEEEQRIFFVGCSRAAKTLTISYVGAPSPFIRPFINNFSVDKENKTVLSKAEQTSLWTI